MNRRIVFSAIIDFIFMIFFLLAFCGIILHLDERMQEQEQRLHEIENNIFNEIEAETSGIAS